eukprot:tig00000057_g125.t1
MAAPRPERVRELAVPFRVDADGSGIAEIVARIPERARIVLIGEASHGTEEFYAVRAEITKRLIVERNFNAVAAEADYPDAARANRYAQGVGRDKNAEKALRDFKRFPTWMWRNNVVANFLEWLRAHNAARAEGREPARFVGMDLYSMLARLASQPGPGRAEAVIQYLARVDPEAAEEAKD